MEMKKNGQVDSLNELCLKYLAEHFTEVITENEIPFVYMNKIITRLPVDLPPLISAKYIDDENYWKRCCFHKYSRHECLVENHGSSWKRLYFEKLLTEQLESFHSGSDIFELLEFVDSIKNIVYCIQLEQLPSHIDSTKILTILSNIETIDIKYRMKKIGINYNRLLFGMKMSDALYLADSIGEMKKLHTLKLTENEMDDDILNALMTGLLNNESIQYLDISHNKISNDGARLVSRLISNNDSLRKIDLSDNNIDDEGAKHMARALIKGSKITGLSLRLNKMSDEGVRCLFEGLQGCKDLEFLDVSFNKGSDQSMNGLIRLLSIETTCLRELNIAGNEFGDNHMTELLEVVKLNSNLCFIDVRNNLTTSSINGVVDEIKSITHDNSLRRKDYKSV